MNDRTTVYDASGLYLRTVDHRVAWCAGQDAATRQAKAQGRIVWSQADYDLAVETYCAAAETMTVGP